MAIMVLLPLTAAAIPHPYPESHFSARFTEFSAGIIGLIFLSTLSEAVGVRDMNNWIFLALFWGLMAFFFRSLYKQEGKRNKIAIVLNAAIALWSVMFGEFLLWFGNNV